MIKQQKIRQLILRMVIIALVLLPAATMAYLTLKSLEEIQYKEDYYYERVGHDLAMNTITALEEPLYAPGMRVIEESLRNENLSNEREINAMLRSLERLDNFTSCFCWYPGPKFPPETRKLYSNPDILGKSLTQDKVSEIDQLLKRVFDDYSKYGALNLRSYPRQYGSATVTITKFSLMNENYVMTFLESGQGDSLGIITYKINFKDYLRRARLLYNEPDFAEEALAKQKDIVADLRAEVFFNLAPFNDAALEATTIDPLYRKYVFRSEWQDSPYWGVRVYNAYPENSRINTEVVRSMIAILAALLALIVFGIFIINYLVTKEIELARIKSAFVSSVSHELKTPLSLIRLFAETLLLGRIESEEEKRRFYEIINNESQRLTLMINNILDFSRIEEGRKQYDFAPYALEELLEETLEAYSYQLEQAGCAMTVTIEENLPLAIVDPNSFKQSVINLLDNAMKYSFRDKQIDVSLARSGAFLRLDVTDKGIGIEKVDLAHIFDKFFRVSNADVYQVKGSGLGLSVVKHIMDAHKGNIEVWSEPGKGSRFSLFFRISRENKNESGDEE